MTEDSYTTIPVKRSTKVKMEKGMDRGETWDGRMLAFMKVFEDPSLSKQPDRMQELKDRKIEGQAKRISELEGELDSARMRKGGNVSKGSSGKVLDSYVEDFEGYAAGVLAKHQFAKKPIDDLVSYVKGWIE